MEKKKAQDPVSDINVTPMVDVMLVLLIIFIVVTPMLSKGISVDMAKAKNPMPMADAEDEDAILVAVSRDGKTYLGTDQTSPDSLPNKVKDLLTKKADKMVYVRADARSRYQIVVEVIDNLRAAGVDQLGMLTEEDQRAKEERQKQRSAAPAAGLQ